MPKTNAEMVRESAARRRQRARAAGLCYTCCKQKPKLGRVVCEACNTAVRDRKRRKRHKEREVAKLRNKSTPFHGEYLSPLETAANALYRDERFEEAAALYAMAVMQTGRACSPYGLYLYARTLALIGEEESSVGRYLEAAEAALEAGELELLAEVYEKLANQYWSINKNVEALKTARKIRDLALPRESPRRVRGLVREARLLIVSGKATEALQLIEDVERSDFQADLDTLATILEVKGYALDTRGDTRAGLDNLIRACELAEKRTDWDSAVVKLNNFALIACYSGETRLALDAHARAVAITSAHHAGWRIAYAMLRAASTHAQIGQFREARDLLVRIDEIHLTGRNASNFSYMAAWVGSTIEDASLLNRVNLGVLVSALSLPEPQFVGRLVGCAYAVLRREVPGELNRALQRIWSADIPLHTMWPLVSAIAQHGELENIDRMMTKLAGIQLKTPIVTGNEMLLQLARSHFSGEPVNRIHAIETVDIFRELGWRYHQALALEYGEDIRQARALYKKMSLVKDFNRLENVEPSKQRLLLTSREQSVSKLLALGRTNQEIAAELHIAASTVKSHVSNILRHYGISRRNALQAKIHLLADGGSDLSPIS